MSDTSQGEGWWLASDGQAVMTLNSSTVSGNTTGGAIPPGYSTSDYHSSLGRFTSRIRMPGAVVGDVPDALPDESATPHKLRTYGMERSPGERETRL